MELTDHSAKRESKFKKAKMIHNEEKVIPILMKQETGVDIDQRNVQVPLMGTEVRTDIDVALDHKSSNGEVRSLAVEEETRHASVPSVEETRDVSVLSVEAKVEEINMSEALGCEERNGVSAVLGNSDPKEVSALELEECKEDAIVSSGDSNMKKIPLCELEEKKDASVDADRNEIPRIESIEKKNGSSASSLRKKLLVLDLNGLLADIVSSPPKDHVSDINIARRAIFKRPFCDDFLKFCFEKFEVGIWSSRTQRNVERITDYLLGDMKSKLLFRWDVSQCAKSTVGSLENKYKRVVFKQLKRLWEKQDPDLPWKKGDYNETNTVLLDDSPYKALLNPPHTAVFPHSYNYLNKSDTSLGVDGDLRLYLEKLAEAENVQEFIKNHPLGQDPITETSEYWEFYRQIIGELHW